ITNTGAGWYTNLNFLSSICCTTEPFMFCFYRGQRPLHINPQVRSLIEGIIEIFSVPSRGSSVSTSSLPAFNSIQSTPYPSPTYHPNVKPMLLICPSDVTTLFYFLCPRFRPLSPLSIPTATLSNPTPGSATSIN